jgi:hypothetical protein
MSFESTSANREEFLRHIREVLGFDASRPLKLYAYEPRGKTFVVAIEGVSRLLGIPLKKQLKLPAEKSVLFINAVGCGWVELEPGWWRPEPVWKNEPILGAQVTEGFRRSVNALFLCLQTILKKRTHFTHVTRLYRRFRRFEMRLSALQTLQLFSYQGTRVNRLTLRQYQLPPRTGWALEVSGLFRWFPA